MGCNTSQEQKSSSMNEGNDAVGAADESQQGNQTTSGDNTRNDKNSGNKTAKSLKSEKDNCHIDGNASKNEGEEPFFNRIRTHLVYNFGGKVVDE